MLQKCIAQQKPLAIGFCNDIDQLSVGFLFCSMRHVLGMDLHWRCVQGFLNSSRTFRLILVHLPIFRNHARAAGVGGFSLVAAGLPFPTILLRRGFAGLPLHVGRFIRSSTRKWLDVIDHISWARASRFSGSWTGIVATERVANCGAAMDSPVRVAYAMLASLRAEQCRGNQERQSRAHN
jgi:hypothetical protein